MKRQSWNTFRSWNHIISRYTISQETSWHILTCFNICLEFWNNPEIILDEWWACSWWVERLDDRLFGGMLDSRGPGWTSKLEFKSESCSSLKYVRIDRRVFSDVFFFSLLHLLASQVVENLHLSLVGMFSVCLHFVLPSQCFFSTIAMKRSPYGMWVGIRFWFP